MSRKLFKLFLELMEELMGIAEELRMGKNI